ncbi:MAG: hypothetical protein ACM34K_19875 [Bacillota bacterium]
MKALFLGSGYTGNFFRILYPYSIHSFRNKENILKHGGGVLFNVNDRSTWHNIEKTDPDGIVISFPLNECDYIEEFLELCLKISERIAVIGTTSGFQKNLSEITDESPLDSTNPRTAAEEYFRKKGASVIHSAGIYGPGRNPLDWIKRGLIRNSMSTVNLVHAEDLARACSFILENFSQCSQFVLSDGHPYKWKEIIQFALKKHMISESDIPPDSPQSSARIVKPLRLFDMGFTLRHPVLFDELQSLEPI